MKLIVLVFILGSFWSHSQTLFERYMTDTFTLSEAYLYERAVAWFEKSGDEFTITFEAVEEEGKPWKLGAWIADGGYTTNVNILSEYTFSFDIKWVQNDTTHSCTYVGTLTESRLFKMIDCESECPTQPHGGPGFLYFDGQSSLWPGYIPPGYEVIRAKIVNARKVGLMGEYVLGLDILDENGDSLFVELPYPLEYYLADFNVEDYYKDKTVDIIYRKGWKTDSRRFTGMQMAIIEEEE